ncbi:uncharacterized protein LOC107428322 isoform X2 [Ziziphus jujuba]|nr:uncharacterized protein LOC107428322 isoform X2 [Ziziphus jujuba]
MAQVNSLRQELQILASNRSITIVNSSRTASGATKYGVIIVVVVVGYGYVWWKGWKLPDMMFATRRSLSDACTSVSKQLERVYSSISATNRRLSSQIDGVEHSLDESLENANKTKQEVSELLGRTGAIGIDVRSVHETVQNLKNKIDTIEEKQDWTTLGVMELCYFAQRSENSRTTEQIKVESSSPRPALDLPPKSPSRTGSLPPISRPLPLPDSSGSYQEVNGISEVIGALTGGDGSNGIATPEVTKSGSSSSSRFGLGSGFTASFLTRTRSATNAWLQQTRSANQ